MKLIVDFMCGKLVRWLRVLGLDAEYFRETDTRALLKRALSEELTIVTRNSRLSSTPGVSMLLLKSEIPEEQVKQVLDELGLLGSIALFARCIVCNGELKAVSKEDVRGRVPFYTFQRQERFKKCPGCGRIYWEGTHVEHMKRRIAELLGGEDGAQAERPDGSHGTAHR
jgi:uncharacterized protein with PIN domain